MSQHSFSIADEAGAAYRADVNNALQALASVSRGATAPATIYIGMYWEDTTASLLKRRNAANSAWLVVGSLDETFVVSRASNTILGLSDYGKTFVATAGFTQTLTAAATLGDGWQVDYRIEAGVTVVFDPNASENIDGATTKIVTGPAGGTIRCDGSGFKTVGLTLAAFDAKFIQGLTYANNAGDATNDLDIAAGSCRDATDAMDIVLASALTKQSDVAWAVGTAAGGLDTGAVGNSDYYIWLIKRSDTGVVDALFSLSSTAPTMPANYNFKRLIGWFKRVGGTIVAFTTYEIAGGGIQFAWKTITQEVSLANTLTTSRRTDAVKVPLNFATLADLCVGIGDGTTLCVARIMCPDETDAAVSGLNANITSPSVGINNYQQMSVMTSSAGLIAARANLATVDSYSVSTNGFTWARRN